MSLHPNELARRGRLAGWALGVLFFLFLAAFFRTQIVQHSRYTLQSEENRLREVPVPAPRGIIYDRNLQILAENVPGYSVQLLSPNADSLRGALQRIAAVVPLTPDQIDLTVRRFQRNPARPALVLADAPFNVVSVLEERRLEFPGLVIESAPKRYYPAGAAIAPVLGYVGEITDQELRDTVAFKGYRVGEQVGKMGLEREYQDKLRGRDGSRFVEVDARGRVVREEGARADLAPVSGPALMTNIDLDLQRYVAGIFGDSLQGGAIALDPTTGAVLALYSAPTYDPNQFVGGISPELWKALNADPRHPLFNKVTQGRYPPGSTWKLATAAVALQDGIVTLDEQMPEPCTGTYHFGDRDFHCWEKHGHGKLTLQRAIEVSCDIYFYQLALKVGLSKLVAGGIALGGRDRSGIDLPDEARPTFPSEDVKEYYDRRYGRSGWSQAVVLNLGIGQGENDQSVASMARLYTAFATDGNASTPMVVRRSPEHAKILTLTAAQLDGIRAAMAGVVSRGTATSAQIQGVVLAGKTGTAQNAQDPLHDHAWFVGFAPANDPKIVVAVLLEFGGHGDRAARIASKIVQAYLKVAPAQLLNTDG
ncbi:MAG TPA: penicillin-binding protein 2 [Gemmatimonadaceae bacterium]|nr:penicillin-binding protein 2 [Gemmatimonadaceae bacterium]